MERGDEEAAVGLEHDEVVAGQPVECFANRGARDGERVREISLSEPRARLDLAVLDQRLDPPVGEIDDRAAVDRLNGYPRRVHECGGV